MISKYYDQLLELMFSKTFSDRDNVRETCMLSTQLVTKQ